MAKKHTAEKETFTRWDAVDYLKSDADIAAYLDAALEAAVAENDVGLLAAVLGDIAKARGVLKVAADAGMTRQGLYKALDPHGNPSFATVLKVARALDLGLKFTPRAVV